MGQAKTAEMSTQRAGVVSQGTCTSCSFVKSVKGDVAAALRPLATMSVVMPTCQTRYCKCYLLQHTTAMVPFDEQQQHHRQKAAECCKD